MYEQVTTPMQPFPYVGGWCEGFVEGSFGEANPPVTDVNGNWYTTGVHASATSAWDTNVGGGNHPNEQPPSGLYVPVYFTLGSTPAGHVAIVRPDGTVLSSTQEGWHATGYVHPNLQHLIDLYTRYNGSCGYLGWTEFVGNKRVIAKKEDEVKPTEAQVVDTFNIYLLKPPVDQAQVDYYTSKDIRVLYGDVLGATKPSADEVTKVFGKYLPGTTDKNRIPYYTNKIATLLYSDISGALHDKGANLEASLNAANNQTSIAEAKAKELSSQNEILQDQLNTATSDLAVCKDYLSKAGNTVQVDKGTDVDVIVNANNKVSIGAKIVNWFKSLFK